MINIEKENFPNGGTKFTMEELKDYISSNNSIHIENNTIDIKKYIEFVRQTTSKASSDFPSLLSRLTELQVDNDADIPRLMTAAFGMSAEAGEFTEVVKKIILQGKPYNEENVFHLKRELGDICWYLAQACMSLDTDFEEILQMNFEKLSARYPEGTFDVFRSENRVEGDL